MRIDLRIHTEDEGLIEMSGASHTYQGAKFLLTSFGDRKIFCIKTVRDLTGLSISDAREAVENLPWTYDGPASKAEELFGAFSKVSDGITFDVVTGTRRDSRFLISLRHLLANL